MIIAQWLIVGLWAVFLAFWLIEATKAKRNVSRRNWARAAAWRIAVVVLVALAIRIPATRQALRTMAALAHNTTLSLIGLVLCALGVGLAIAARVYLGRNWGMPGSQKENPELITGGPYAVIRHPIYTGILLALLGTAIGITPVWLLVLAISAVYFIVSARQEERMMLARFPDAYPGYVKRTKMLLPFIV